MKNLAIKIKRKFTQSQSGVDRNSGSLNARSSGTNHRAITKSKDNESNDSNISHGSSTEGIPTSSATDTDIKSKYDKSDLLEQVASFREVAPEKRRNLFIKKLRLCCVNFDFSNESASENLGKEM